MPTPTAARVIYPLLALAILLGVLDTCPHTIQNASPTLTAFEDLDRDGRQDRDEPPIPNTLVVADFNVHGTFTHLGRLTNEKGEVTLSAEYTHFFNVVVVPPCGSTPTTETTFKPENARRLEVGFAHDVPRAGTATLRLHLWHDEKANGEQDLGEPPLADQIVFVDVEGGHNLNRGVLEARTGADGWTTIDLGNSCGTVWLRVPDSWSIPAGLAEREWQAVTYNLGETTVEWGLERMTRSPTPTPEG
jgi:hypothetical protein